MSRKAGTGREAVSPGSHEPGGKPGDESRSELRDESKAELRDESPVHITARTDDGRRVEFRHDEIRDFHGNVRLDYGYAMTIASAQGLTVDRAFLLVDDRPARETIYPAATRHREGIDVYVNRSPLAFDIAERRPEDQADMPVTDSEVRGYLAERWSRSEPKEAALDYIAEGAWRDPREAVRDGRAHPDGMRQAGTAPANAAANDNALVRIAGEIRHAVAGWRHGAAVDAFAAERGRVLAQWEGLRERTRADGDAVALSPAFRETLERHGALMRQAASFRARPQVFERLLSERAGIGANDLDDFEQLHERASRHRRAARMRQVHREKQGGGTPRHRDRGAPGRAEAGRRTWRGAAHSCPGTFRVRLAHAPRPAGTGLERSRGIRQRAEPAHDPHAGL